MNFLTSVSLTFIFLPQSIVAKIETHIPKRDTSTVPVSIVTSLYLLSVIICLLLFKRKHPNLNV